ncbi:MAG: hypothetical protein K2X66_11150 [Cyanobacteria bacterium]|nr:hypothetical protein [Cyanobacteriota bacterium]
MTVINPKNSNGFLRIPNFQPKASAFGKQDRNQLLRPVKSSLSFGKNHDEPDSFHPQSPTTPPNASGNPPTNNFSNNDLNPTATSKPSTPNGSIYAWGYGPDIPEDAFIPEEFQGFKNLLTLKAQHHLTEGQVSQLNTLLQEVKENQRPSEEVDFLFKKIMSRLKNMFGHKMSAEMRDSVFLLSGLDAKLLSPRQRQSMGQVVGAFILRHLGKQWDLKNFHHQGYLSKLKALGKPYGRETMVDTLINYPKIQVINGVQCVLSGKREGEPLKTIKMASSLILFFNLMVYPTSKHFHTCKYIYTNKSRLPMKYTTDAR